MTEHLNPNGYEAELYYMRYATVEACMNFRLEQKFRFHFHRLKTEEEIIRCIEEMRNERVQYQVYTEDDYEVFRAHAFRE